MIKKNRKMLKWNAILDHPDFWMRRRQKYDFLSKRIMARLINFCRHAEIIFLGSLRDPVIQIIWKSEIVIRISVCTHIKIMIFTVAFRCNPNFLHFIEQIGVFWRHKCTPSDYSCYTLELRAPKIYELDLLKLTLISCWLNGCKTVVPYNSQ